MTLCNKETNKSLSDFIGKIEKYNFMNKLLIQETKAEEIDKIVSIEANKENQQFIISNTKTEHLQLLKNPDIAHLIVKSVDKQTIGFVILGGLASHSQSIEFRRIVINEKGKGHGRKVIQFIKKK